MLNLLPFEITLITTLPTSDSFRTQSTQCRAYRLLFATDLPKSQTWYVCKMLHMFPPSSQGERARCRKSARQVLYIDSMMMCGKWIRKVINTRSSEGIKGGT